MRNLFMLLVILATVLGCDKNENNNTSSAPKRTIQYSVACSDCYVYCRGAEGSAQNFYHQNSTWTYSYEAGAHDTLLLIAQNTSGAPALIAGAIRLNGTLIAADTSYCPISGTVIVSDTL